MMGDRVRQSTSRVSSHVSFPCSGTPRMMRELRQLRSVWSVCRTSRTFSWTACLAHKISRAESLAARAWMDFTFTVVFSTTSLTVASILWYNSYREEQGGLVPSGRAHCWVGWWYRPAPTSYRKDAKWVGGQ